MSDTSIHDWLRPLLARLVQDGVDRGHDRQAVIAVLIDLATTEDFGAPLTPPPLVD